MGETGKWPPSPPLDEVSTAETREAGSTYFVDTNEAGGDIDNDEEVTRSVNESEVWIRVGLFPILIINSLNSFQIDLHALVVDCPVEIVLPDFFRMGFLTLL